MPVTLKLQATWDRLAELLEHAKMSLMQAREAQRAGNVAGLNEGIANLRKALSLPHG